MNCVQQHVNEVAVACTHSSNREMTSKMHTYIHTAYHNTMWGNPYIFNLKVYT